MGLKDFNKNLEQTEEHIKNISNITSFLSRIIKHPIGIFLGVLSTILLFLDRLFATINIENLVRNNILIIFIISIVFSVAFVVVIDRLCRRDERLAKEKTKQKELESRVNQISESEITKRHFETEETKRIAERETTTRYIWEKNAEKVFGKEEKEEPLEREEQDLKVYQIRRSK